jgi:hypothetical protein
MKIETDLFKRVTVGALIMTESHKAANMDLEAYYRCMFLRPIVTWDNRGISSS